MPQPNLGFLEEYILKVLEQSGLGQLTEENKAKYLPQLTAKAEYDIGLALMPKLDEASASKFGDMMEDESITAEQWQEFWKQSVPDYEKVVQDVLVEFGKKVQGILKQ